MNQNRSMKRYDLKELMMTILSSSVDATTNFEKNFVHWKIPWWASRKKCFSPNFNRLAILVFVLVLNIPVDKGKYMLWFPIFNVCWTRNALCPVLFQHKGWLSSVHQCMMQLFLHADLSDLHSWLEPNFSAPMTMLPNQFLQDSQDLWWHLHA